MPSYKPVHSLLSHRHEDPGLRIKGVGIIQNLKYIKTNILLITFLPLLIKALYMNPAKTVPGSQLFLQDFRPAFRRLQDI